MKYLVVVKFADGRMETFADSLGWLATDQLLRIKLTPSRELCIPMRLIAHFYSDDEAPTSEARVQ